MLVYGRVSLPSAVALDNWHVMQLGHNLLTEMEILFPEASAERSFTFVDAPMTTTTRKVSCKSH